ncbi:MAG TPA: serine/threonine-protein kinase [Holophagaceae bacterium]|nr:serine/threonine-protein kinase [Holophagaceae bacterium]
MARQPKPADAIPSPTGGIGIVLYDPYLSIARDALALKDAPLAQWALDQSERYGGESDGSRTIFRVKLNKLWDPDQDARFDRRMAAIRTYAQRLNEARKAGQPAPPSPSEEFPDPKINVSAKAPMPLDPRAFPDPYQVAEAPLPGRSTLEGWEATYLEGLRLEKEGDPASALLAFQASARLHPQPAGRTTLTDGRVLDAYSPYLRQAAAALAAEDLLAADKALGESSRWALEPSSERGELRKRLSDRVVSYSKAGKDWRQAKAQPLVAAQVPPKASEAAPDPAASHGPIAAPPPPAQASGTPTKLPLEATPPSTPSTAPSPRGGWPWAAGGGLVTAMGAGLWLAWRPRRKAPSDSDATTFIPKDRITHPPAASAGPWNLTRELGRGATCITYLGIHRGDHRPAAVKVPYPHLHLDAEFLARFRQEARLGQRLDHPGVVRIVDPGPEEGIPWLALEFVEGEGLDRHLQRKGRLAIAEVIDLGLDMAQALAYAHAHGVIHRDLKPANVMLSSGRAKVVDFGIARVVDATAMTATQAFLGTPLYASPEALLGSRVDGAADRYALGIVLFELLTGQPPFQGPHGLAVLEKHRSQPLPDLREGRSDIPPALAALVQRLGAKDPAHRPTDEALVAELQVLREAR